MSAELMSVEDQQFLDLTQNTRRKIISKMLEKGTLPESEEDRNFLLKAMDGGDKQVLTKAKLKSDDSNAKNAANVQQQIVEMYGAIRAASSVPAAPSERELPKQDINLVPGHMEIGRNDITLTQLGVS